MKKKLLSYFNSNKDKIINTLNDLHSIPEIGFQETKTANYLSNRLKESGYSVKTKIGGTGVIGVLDSGKQGPCVGLRADMDALLHEIDGNLIPIHSCGHDANCTIVLSVAEAFANLTEQLNGQLKIIFQPAEETLSGAKALIESKEIEGIDYLIGTHLRPMEELPFGKIAPSIRHGASAIMLVDVIGSEAHGARPHQGINAIDTCCSIIIAANGIRVNPQIPHSIKATMIKSGGNAFNIIPGKAEIAFDLRSQTNKEMIHIKKSLMNICKKVGESLGAKVICNLKGEVPAAQDNEELVNIAKACIEEVLGKKGVAEPIITSGGEDFHNYSYEMKELKATMLGIGADLTPGLHKQDMTFNKEALIFASEVMALMVSKILI